MIISQGARTDEQQGDLPGLLQSLYHICCKQASALNMLHDDIQYRHLLLSKVVICARVTALEKGVSPRGMPTLQVKCADSTGTCRVVFYERQGLENILQSGQYLKMTVAAKCGGVAYRQQLTLTGCGVVELRDPNELTEHFLECMKTQIAALC